MKKHLKILIGATVFILIGLGIGFFIDKYYYNDLYVPEIEIQARSSQHIPEDWDATSETTKNTAAVLLYHRSLSEHIFLIYTNDQPLDMEPEYSLLGGGVIPVNLNEVAEISSKSFDEYIYVSLNLPGISLMEISGDNFFSTKEIDPNKPFVIIQSGKKYNVTFYDTNNNIIEYDSIHL